MYDLKQMKKDLFQKVYNGLASQGFNRSVEHPPKGNIPHCLYRGENGAKCAIGHLISDDLAKKMDDIGLSPRTSYSIMHGLSSFTSHFCFETNDEFLKEMNLADKDEKFKSEILLFLADLQVLHDVSKEPEIMKQNLINLAKKQEIQFQL